MKQKSLLLTIAVLLGLRIAATAQTPPSYVPTDGLVGWWPFNGNANDESGNGNDGTVNGATLTEDRNSAPTSAYNFDGNSFIEVAHSNSLTISEAMTFSLWFKQGIMGNTINYMIQKGSGGGCSNVGFHIAVDYNFGLIPNGTKILQFGQNSNCAGLGSDILLDESWHSMIIVYNPNIGHRMYIDGVLVEEGFPYGCGACLISNETTPMRIGALYSSLGGFNWNGQLDDIGIWNRALTPEEIAGLYYAAECTHDLTLAPENSVSNLGSTVSFTANTSDVNPVYTWQTDFGQGFQNVVDYGNYSGASTSTLTISDLQLNNHNQPLRVISTSGICVDTSEVAFISLADTCITHVFDTTYITVTDTLIININPTGFNPLTYANTILMYPNPASDQLTINYGDFASLAGYSLKIFNSIGQEIHSANISQQQEVLQLATWGGAGTYEVVIYNAQGVPVETRAIVLE